MTEVTSLSLAERESLATLMGAVKGIDWGTFPNHEWKRNPDGTINDWVLDIEYHNGPGCVRCGYSYCEHCWEDREVDVYGEKVTHPTDSECNVPPPRYSLEDLIKTFGFRGVELWWDREDGLIAGMPGLGTCTNGPTAYDAVARLVIKIKGENE